MIGLIQHRNVKRSHRASSPGSKTPLGTSLGEQEEGNGLNHAGLPSPDLTSSGLFRILCPSLLLRHLSALQGSFLGSHPARK